MRYRGGSRGRVRAITRSLEASVQQRLIRIDVILIDVILILGIVILGVISDEVAFGCSEIHYLYAINIGNWRGRLWPFVVVRLML